MGRPMSAYVVLSLAPVQQCQQADTHHVPVPLRMQQQHASARGQIEPA
jgi:hypothetical protein